MTESSLFVYPHFLCTTCVASWHCLYSEKDVVGGLCHGHISHLVHPKTLLRDRLQHAKKGPKNLANAFFDALAILKCRLTPANFFRRWQIPLTVTSSTGQTSQLDKINLTSWLVTLPSHSSSNHLTGYNLSSWLVKSTWTIIISRKCRTLQIVVK